MIDKQGALIPFTIRWTNENLSPYYWIYLFVGDHDILQKICEITCWCEKNVKTFIISEEVVVDTNTDAFIDFTGNIRFGFSTIEDAAFFKLVWC